MALLAATIPGGCVTEVVEEPGPSGPPLFRFPQGGTIGSGVYHGVSVFLEVDPKKDLSPEEIRWMEREGERDTVNVQLPPLVPAIAGPQEVYRYKDIHRFDLLNGMFHVGAASYIPRQRARLYIFKQRAESFAFFYRGQKVVVPAERPWVPSLYYYREGDERGAARGEVREVLQIGPATIESAPGKPGALFVNGKLLYPDPSRELELAGVAR